VRTARLGSISVDDIVEVTSAVRTIAEGCDTMAQAAQQITAHLRIVLVDEDGRPACPLVRIYTTARGRALPANLASRAHRSDEGTPGPSLLLLGTSGALPEWNDRRLSASHSIIPLDRAQVLADRAPMIAGLLAELGVDIDTFVDLEETDAKVIQHQEYGVFHVQEATGSRLIPAQDFVAAHHVRSVVGCGGGLPSGEVFVLVLFSCVEVDETAASMFRTLAFGLKAALVPFTYKLFTPL
jgi:hypothetical protein